jgi:uncharacterized protein
MKFFENTTTGKYIINACDEHAITVNNNNYNKTIIVLNTKIIELENTKNVASINEKILDLTIQEQPEIVVIGTGVKLAFLPESIKFFYENKRIGIEVADTKSACGNFTLLCSDNRMISALLIIE